MEALCLDDTIQGLIKFGQKEDMEKLLKRGEIFCRPLSHFQKIEENDLAKRYDMFEGASRLVQSDVLRSEGISVLISEHENTIDITSYILGPIIEPGEKRIAVYCLYAVYGSHPTVYRWRTEYFN
jgi:hypothetical protein